MKKIAFQLFLFFLIAIPMMAQSRQPHKVTISRQQLKDKIMGGWAGQTIGVTFGGPYEFRYNGTFIQEYQPLLWYKGYVKKVMTDNPGLYDDLYMDLTFVDVFEKMGLDAPVDSFASAFAHAGYKLWHANQAARYNILQGMRAPASGNWVNNPHADDIDYQIECDYAGLMSPGMPNTASAISDKIGHIMNYGNGWYGGVYLGAMYSLAFVSDDISYIVTEALKSVPNQSSYYQCISDVIKWHKQYPEDWHQAWFELQKKWSSDISCPDGVFMPFNIDATINSAYVVLGLLYGNGDYTKTLDISTRAGQDADCNPSSAGGILGTMLGYSKIPAYWKDGLQDAGDIDFKYTSISLNKVYEIGFRHALENIKRNGGNTSGDNIILSVQTPLPVKYEKGFQGMVPVLKQELTATDPREINFDFEGTGFILRGEARAKTERTSDYVFETEIYVDGEKSASSKLPTDFTTRKLEIAWKYPLLNKKHSIKIKVLNPDSRYELRNLQYIVYSDKSIPAQTASLYK